MYDWTSSLFSSVSFYQASISLSVSCTTTVPLFCSSSLHGLVGRLFLLSLTLIMSLIFFLPTHFYFSLFASLSFHFFLLLVSHSIHFHCSYRFGRHPFPRPYPPTPQLSQGVFRPGGVYNPFTVFWVSSGVS